MATPALLDANKLRKLYATLLRCRMVAETARVLIQQGKFPSDIAAASGHEAAEVGALIDLLAEDCVAPGRRDFMARFIQGTPLKVIFAELYARQAGTGDGWSAPAPHHNARAAMIAPGFSLSAQLNLATGVAWAAKSHEKPNVAVAFSGNDSPSLGFWRDAVNFSAAHKLPIVHVVENNAGDESVSAGLRMAGHGMVGTAHGGLPVFTVDGNDVVAVCRVAQEAIRRARQGHGPALIECQTYRWSSRSQTDSAGTGVTAVEQDRSTDPISCMEAYLEPRRLWSKKWKDKLTKSFSRELDKAVAFAERSRKPLPQADSVASSPPGDCKLTRTA